VRILRRGKRTASEDIYEAELVTSGMDCEHGEHLGNILSDLFWCYAKHQRTQVWVATLS